MNPFAILVAIVAIVIGFIAFSGRPFGDLGPGPIATGPGQDSNVQNPQPAAGGRGPTAPVLPTPSPSPTPLPGDSPYKGVVTIGAVQSSGISPQDEYVTVRYSGGYSSYSGGQTSQPAPIDVTGWSIASARSSAPFPPAFNIPEFDAAAQDIFLPPSGELIIVTGTPTYTWNFRENACVGYFTQTHSFVPPLSTSCPDDNPNRATLIARGFNGECIDTIEAVPACRTPQGPFLAGIIGVSCVDYLNQHFTYSSCVRDFRTQPNFFLLRWRVSLKLPQKLFDPKHDRVILRDRQGLRVDEFEY